MGSAVSLSTSNLTSEEASSNAPLSTRLLLMILERARRRLRPTARASRSSGSSILFWAIS